MREFDIKCVIIADSQTRQIARYQEKGSDDTEHRHKMV